MSLQDADEYEVTAHLARIEARLTEITEETARLTAAVRQLADEDRQGRLIAQLMVAAHVYFWSVTHAPDHDMDEAARLIDKGIDGILTVNNLITHKQKEKDNGRRTEDSHAG